MKTILLIMGLLGFGTINIHAQNKSGNCIKKTVHHRKATSGKTAVQAKGWQTTLSAGSENTSLQTNEFLQNNDSLKTRNDVALNGQQKSSGCFIDSTGEIGYRNS